MSRPSPGSQRPVPPAPAQLQFAVDLFGTICEPREADPVEPPAAPRHLRLVEKGEQAPYLTPPPLQFTLPDLFAPPANLVRLVPRNRYPALDRHFPSLAARDRKLSRLATRLALAGKIRLGHVVALSDFEILELGGSDRVVLGRVEALLARFGLGLGMTAPRWRSPGGVISANW
jgi:hypothetical protein